MSKRLQVGLDIHQKHNHVCLMTNEGQMVNPPSALRQQLARLSATPRDAGQCP
jgi:hypothetical protein